MEAFVPELVASPAVAESQGFSLAEVADMDNSLRTTLCSSVSSHKKPMAGIR